MVYAPPVYENEDYYPAPATYERHDVYVYHHVTHRRVVHHVTHHARYCVAPHH